MVDLRFSQGWLWKVLSSMIQHHVVRSKSADVSEEQSFLPAYCWFLALLIQHPWIWRRYVPPKRRLIFNGRKGVLSQKVKLYKGKVDSSNALFTSCSTKPSCHLMSAIWMSGTASYPQTGAIRQYVSADSLLRMNLGSLLGVLIQQEIPNRPQVSFFLLFRLVVLKTHNYYYQIMLFLWIIYYIGADSTYVNLSVVMLNFRIITI
jgi:hypothetical protein